MLDGIVVAVAVGRGQGGGGGRRAAASIGSSVWVIYEVHQTYLVSVLAGIDQAREFHPESGPR